MLYDNFVQFRSRLVGMADEVDSKSIGLIPRAGSTPATGTIFAPKCYASEHFLLLRSKILNIFWKRRKNCICRRDLIISIISGNALFRQGQRDGRKYLTVPKSFAEKHQLPKSSSARRIRSTIFTWNGHWLWQTSQPTHSPALCSRAS